MHPNIILALAVSLILGCFALAQTSPQKKSQTPDAQAAADFAGSMAQRLSNDLHVKTVIGEPLKVGSVTLIPILTFDVSFGGGAMDSPTQAAAPQSPLSSADAFFMSGEANGIT